MREIMEKIKKYLKVQKPQKNEMMMVYLILILIKIHMKKNQKKNIGEKKAKKISQNQINQKLMKEITDKIKKYFKNR